MMMSGTSLRKGIKLEPTFQKPGFGMSVSLGKMINWYKIYYISILNIIITIINVNLLIIIKDF